MTTTAQPFPLKAHPHLLKAILLIAREKGLTPRPVLEEALLDDLSFKLSTLIREDLGAADFEFSTLTKGELYTLVNGEMEESCKVLVSSETFRLVQIIHEWTALPIPSKTVEMYRGQVRASWKGQPNHDLHGMNVIVEDFNPHCAFVRVWMVEGEETSRVIDRLQVFKMF